MPYNLKPPTPCHSAFNKTMVKLWLKPVLRVLFTLLGPSRLLWSDSLVFARCFYGQAKKKKKIEKIVTWIQVLAFC